MLKVVAVVATVRVLTLWRLLSGYAVFSSSREYHAGALR
jgi:hypothetical protein